jgi:LysM repeat protein
MRNQSSGKCAIVLLSLVVVCVLLFGSPPAGAQPKTHTVQKGDTLWDICQKYYGDPNLWPKLWEMNPFVTNPHLLKPGDIITLFEDGELEKEKVAKPAEKAAPSAPEMKGVDMSRLTKPEAMGFFSLVEVESWGFIEATTSSKMGLSEGDMAFVRFGKNGDTIRKGQEFAITSRSSLIRHPLTDRPLGYIVATRGKLVILERIKQNHFRAEVTQLYSEVGVGSLLMPSAPYSACVHPMATDPKLYGNIIALKDNQKVVGQFSVVYLDAGFKDGARRGSVFDLIKVIRVPSPNLQEDSYEEIFAEVVGNFSKEEYLSGFWKKLQEGEKLYEQSVGKILVIEARPDTSTAVVLTSSQDLARGAFVKGVSWVEVPDYLDLLPSCPLE